ncbi:MAG: molybdopterin-dependent oxidoreductase [Thermodesulfovibrionales bacterium]
MGKTVNIKVDGKEIAVDDGLNLIEAAAAAGVHIPNLCYIKGMKGIGACRLCLVELEGAKAPVIACNTKVKDGMSVLTKTEKVQEVRKFVIDLILSMHPLDCMTCTKAGVCSLQQYAYDFEIKESSFTRKKTGYPVDSANPFVKRDPDYCVLCGRCIRVCKAQGTNVLDFSGRGVGAKVVTANDTPLQESTCTFCGSCIDACPVNAILEADRWRKGREWEYAKTESVCLSCGNGCSIIVSAKDGQTVKINAGAAEGSVERFICAVGRFGFDSYAGDLRVASPMKRVDGKLQPTTWDDALATAAARLTAAGTDAAFITSGNILNEDAILVKKLADGVKSKNCDSSVSLYAGPDSMNASTADLDNADLIVLAGVAPDQWKRILPAFDAMVRKRVDAGAKLIVITAGEPRIAAAAHAVVRGDELKKIQELCQALIAKGVKAPKEMIEALAPVNPADDAMAAADLFEKASSPVIIAAPSLYGAAVNLSLIKGDAVAAPLEANAKGVQLMGLVPEGKKFNEIVASKSAALYAVGDVPVSARPDTGFLIVQTPYMTDLAMQADVVLPAASPLEVSGTIVDALGRLRQVNKACDAPADARPNADILIAVSEAMGAGLKAPKDTDIKKALKTKAKPAFTPFKRGAGADIDAEKFVETCRKSLINGSRLLWLKELEQGVTA